MCNIIFFIICIQFMYKYGDYSAYINSLKNKKTCNGNYINTNVCQINSSIPSCCPNNTGNDILFTDKGTDCKTLMITYDKRVTYIEPSLDTSESETSINRVYILQSNNSIPNGTFKTIVNNININKSSNVILVTEKHNGFTVYNKYYSEYTFVYGGEDLELLWNSGLNNGSGSWTVVKYNGIFK
jgi:hypothetical protein